MKIQQHLKKEADLIFHYCPYDISDQAFSQRGKVHEWKNYIHDSIEQVWDQLSEEARLVALIMAESMADKEEWD